MSCSSKSRTAAPLLAAWLGLVGCGGAQGSDGGWGAPEPIGDGLGAFLVDGGSKGDATVVAVQAGRRVVRIEDGEAEVRFDAGEGGVVSPIVRGGNEVFFLSTEEDGTKLRAVLVTGGESRVLATRLKPYRGGGHPVAVDANDVFFIDGPRVRKVPIPGGDPITVFDQPATTLWTTRAHLYVGGRGLHRLPLTGGEATTLVPDAPIECGVTVGSRVIAGDGVGAAGALHAVDLDAPPSEGIARLRRVGCPLASHGTTVFASGGGSVMTFDVNQGTPSKALAPPAPPVAMVATKGALYVSDRSGTLSRFRTP